MPTDSDFAGPGKPSLPRPPLSGSRYCGPLPDQGVRHFHGYEQPLAEFPAFTHINEAICSPEHHLPDHRHPAWEICYFLSGRAEWHVGDEKFQIGPGDIFLSRPGEVHGGRPDLKDPNHNFAIGFDPACLPLHFPTAIAELDLHHAVAETRSCDASFGIATARVLHTGPGPELLFRRILGELDALEKDPQQRTLCLAMIQALMIELFVTVTRAGLAQGQAQGHATRPKRHDLSELVAWISTRLDAPPSLEEMVGRIGLSPSHLVAVFRQEVGLTPLEQLTEMRISEACRRLADPRAQVTEVAHALGFCSSQYFSAVFRRRRGCTPSAWRFNH